MRDCASALLMRNTSASPLQLGVWPCCCEAREGGVRWGLGGGGVLLGWGLAVRPPTPLLPSCPVNELSSADWSSHTFAQRPRVHAVGLRPTDWSEHVYIYECTSTVLSIPCYCGKFFPAAVKQRVVLSAYTSQVVEWKWRKFNHRL